MAMVNVTLAVPEELKKKMDSFAEINWSAVARQAFSQKISDLEILNRFTEKSTFTEKDAERLGKKVGEALTKRLQQTAKG